MPKLLKIMQIPCNPVLTPLPNQLMVYNKIKFCQIRENVL